MEIPEYRPGNRIVCGSTRSGKSTGEIIDVIAAAMSFMAIVVIDPHMRSLAWNAFVQLVARGFGKRVLFDRLSNLSRVLGYRFLRRSNATNPYRREAEDEQSVSELIELVGRRRDVSSLAKNPQTEQFVRAASKLVLHQKSVNAADIQFALEPHERRFRELVNGCTDESIRSTFQEIANGTIKPGQYAAARRLISGVCQSPAFTLRCRPTFDLDAFLDNGGILLVEGGTQGISADTANTIMGSLALQLFHYVRSRLTAKPRVLLVMDEATNANLIGGAGHEVRALAELQKQGLDIHILVQSPSFPNSFIEDAVFTNCVEHHWYFAANDAVAQQAARDLGDPEFRHAVRGLRRGERYVKRLTKVTREQVTPLPDPWAFPGLSEKKAYKALGEIMKRPEYWSPTSCHESPTNLPEPAESSNSPSNTSSVQDTSSELSPFQRLRIARQKNSDPTGD